MTVVPVHEFIAMQPSRTKYVCVDIPPGGTVYVTCAHRLPPLMHCGGGPIPEPVSSYTTSTPASVNTRMVV